MILHKIKNFEKPKLTGKTSIILPNESRFPAGLMLTKYAINYKQMFYPGEKLTAIINENENLPLGIKLDSNSDIILFSTKDFSALEDSVIVELKISNEYLFFLLRVEIRRSESSPTFEFPEIISTFHSKPGQTSPVICFDQPVDVSIFSTGSLSIQKTPRNCRKIMKKSGNLFNTTNVVLVGRKSGLISKKNSSKL